MDFYKNVECPYCHNAATIDLEKYVVDTSPSERQMGTETEYVIQCEEFKCQKCKKTFSIKGSFWEYPEGAYNCDDIVVIPINQK